MRRTLRSKRGRARYAQRKAIVEPVFGQIKQGRGFRQFLLRGLRQVRGEWALICTTHNVLKLWTVLRRRRRRPGEGLRTRGAAGRRSEEPRDSGRPMDRSVRNGTTTESVLKNIGLSVQSRTGSY
jgi:hypothetical protein